MLTWAGYVRHIGEMRNAYKFLVGKLMGNKSLRRPTNGCKDNIKMDLTDIV